MDISTKHSMSVKVEAIKRFLEEGEIILGIHVIDREPDHVDVYRKEDGKMKKLCTIRDIPFGSVPIAGLNEGVTFSAIGTLAIGGYGNPFPREIVLESRSTIVTAVGAPFVFGGGSFYYADVIGYDF